jgi:hypothetical protein
MQSIRTEKPKPAKWRKEGDFSKFVKYGSSATDREVKYIDEENSQSIFIQGTSNNSLVIFFTTTNKILLEELKTKENHYAKILSASPDDVGISSAFMPALTIFLDTINASLHPLDDNTKKDINEILQLAKKKEIANPISVLELKLESFLNIKKLNGYLDEGAQHELDKIFHQLCGAEDSEPMIRGVEGREYLLFSCADRMRLQRDKVSLLQKEVTLLKAQLAAANRTSVAVHSQSLFGSDADESDVKSVRMSN